MDDDKDFDFDPSAVDAEDAAAMEKLTKGQQKKVRAHAKKAAKKQAAAARVAAQQAAHQAAKGASGEGSEGADVAAGRYGERLVKSLSAGTFEAGGAGHAALAKKYAEISALDKAAIGSTVTVRCRLHSKRVQGSAMVFITIRQRYYTAQALVLKSATVSRQMIKFAGELTKESIIDIVAEVKAAPEGGVSGATQTDVELHVTEIYLTSPAKELPFTMEDASRKQADFDAQNAEFAALEEKFKDDPATLAAEKAKISRYAPVSLFTRLENRVLDLRVPAHVAIFRIQSQIQRFFREALYARNFTEIHTPKIIGGASEGGSEVFKIDYFGKDAFLAQSPQLYKQMALVCDWTPGVFEIAPVFRAENANTHRHLCEFMGMDLEMTIKEHYHEAVDVIDSVFNQIFTRLHKECVPEMEAVDRQYPYEPFKWTYPSLKLPYPEGIRLLREAGVEIASDFEDLNTENEKKLGAIVREKYGTDFYILDKFPLDIRPFYTMPDSTNPKLSNSYDFFIRGQEILSGAQRVHDPVMLRERAAAKGVDIKGIQAYVDSFEFGAEPHAGGGIGLERVVFLFLGLHDIRQSSMFPRDPGRTSP